MLTAEILWIIKDIIIRSIRYISENGVYKVGINVIPQNIDFGFTKIPLQGLGINYFYRLLFGLGIFLALLMLIINSIKLMSSGHDPEKIKEAMAGIQQAVLGLVLIVMAASLVVFINNIVVF